MESLSVILKDIEESAELVRIARNELYIAQAEQRAVHAEIISAMRDNKEFNQYLKIDVAKIHRDVYRKNRKMKSTHYTSTEEI